LKLIYNQTLTNLNYRNEDKTLSNEKGESVCLEEENKTPSQSDILGFSPLFQKERKHIIKISKKNKKKG
jgi:hypothetical protein